MSVLCLTLAKSSRVGAAQNLCNAEAPLPSFRNKQQSRILSKSLLGRLSLVPPGCQPVRTLRRVPCQLPQHHWGLLRGDAGLLGSRSLPEEPPPAGVKNNRPAAQQRRDRPHRNDFPPGQTPPAAGLASRLLPVYFRSWLFAQPCAKAAPRSRPARPPAAPAPRSAAPGAAPPAPPPAPAPPAPLRRAPFPQPPRCGAAASFRPPRGQRGGTGGGGGGSTRGRVCVCGCVRVSVGVCVWGGLRG